MEHYPASSHSEDDAVASMETADAMYIQEIIAKYPSAETSMGTRSTKRTGDYWGEAVAVVCAELGVPLGFQSDQAGGLMIQGDHSAVNYYLNIVNYELRFGVRKPQTADSESRSGLFTLLGEPNHSSLYEHMYAAYTETPITDIIQADPMFEQIRHRQLATNLEIIDHEGFERLYADNREQCIRMYLTRQLPHLQHLRHTIEVTKRFLRPIEIDVEAEADKEYGKYVREERKQREADMPFQMARYEYWQKEYDFTTSLLLEGYEPYTMEDIVPIARDYIISLLAVHPELSPSDLQVDLPDVKKALGELLSKLEKRSNSEMQRDRAEES